MHCIVVVLPKMVPMPIQSISHNVREMVCVVICCVIVYVHKFLRFFTPIEKKCGIKENIPKYFIGKSYESTLVSELAILDHKLSKIGPLLVLRQR